MQKSLFWYYGELSSRFLQFEGADFIIIMLNKKPANNNLDLEIHLKHKSI